MKNEELFSLFREVAEKVEDRPFPNVTPTSVIADLGIDSLSMMQIVGEMESRLEIMIPDDQLVKLETVDDLLGVVASRLSEAG
jgi:acyl carrier protein